MNDNPTLSNSLTVLAEEIRRADAAARQATATAIERALTAGEKLLEAKTLMQHGQWLPWLKENCGISERSAQRYMRIAKNADKLKSATVADLTLEQAAELLSGKDEHERLCEFQAHVAMIGEELAELRQAVDAADTDLTTLQYIVHRSGELYDASVEVQRRAETERDRLELEMAGNAQTLKGATKSRVKNSRPGFFHACRTAEPLPNPCRSPFYPAEPPAEVPLAACRPPCF